MFRGYVVRKRLAQLRGKEKGEEEEEEAKGREEAEEVEPAVSPSGDSGLEEDHGERRRWGVCSLSLCSSQCVHGSQEVRGETEGDRAEEPTAQILEWNPHGQLFIHLYTYMYLTMRSIVCCYIARGSSIGDIAERQGESGSLQTEDQSSSHLAAILEEVCI